MNTKPTNPKDAIGSKKVPLISVVPQRVLAEVSLGMLDGACKYARHNYRGVGVRASVYVDAAGRHLAAWWEGQDIDPDSGLSHITKVISSLMVLRDSMLQGNVVDDRPPRVSEVDWVAGMNSDTVSLLARHPDPKPPCTQIPNVLGAAPVEVVIECADPACNGVCTSSEHPIETEPTVRMRCSNCGKTWPMDDAHACPECK